MNKKQMIEDLLVTALEGGSNYWYYLPNELPKQEGKSYIDSMLAFLEEGGSIQVNDWENEEEKLGELTWESAMKAFELMHEVQPHNYAALIEEAWDANDADVWFQLAVMGEVTFG